MKTTINKKEDWTSWQYEEETRKSKKQDRKWREERRRNRDSKRRYED